MFTCISELLKIASWTKLEAQCSQVSILLGINVFNVYFVCLYFKSITENIPQDLELEAPGRNPDV